MTSVGAVIKGLGRLFNPKDATSRVVQERSSAQVLAVEDVRPESTIGIIAGNGNFPILVSKEARAAGHTVVAACHVNEVDPEIEQFLDASEWIKLGQVGKGINFFKSQNVDYVVFAGGISRVKHFGSLALDSRGAALLLRLRSTKDDIIMRGVAEEIEKEGITVLPCTYFMPSAVTTQGLLCGSELSSEHADDIEVGIAAIRAMSDQHIGQLVVVREGVIVAVEAVEGSNAAIARGGELGGPGTVVVKCAKPTQDMRFDVPTVGLATIEALRDAQVKVLAVEAGRSIILDKPGVLKLAEDSGISIVGITPLENQVLI